MASTGISTQQSEFSVKDTVDRIAGFLQQKGIAIYARIDQQAELAAAGISINSLEFLLFGNPAKGGILMKSNPLVAIDLPLKIICWQDDQQKVSVAWNDADYILKRFSLENEYAELIDISRLIKNALKNR